MSVVREGSPPASHTELKNELLYLAQKQRARIDKLKLDSEVQLKKFAKVRKEDLLKRRDEVRDSIREVQPKLDDVRKHWQRYQLVNSEREGVYNKLSEQYNSAQSRLQVLHEAIAGAHKGTGDGKHSVQQLRDHLGEVESDKAELRKKVGRALDCLVIDENMLKNRQRDEEDYLHDVQQMLEAVEGEVVGEEHHDAGIPEMQDNVRVVETALQEQKQITNDLHDNFVLSTAKRKAMATDFLHEARRSTAELTKAQKQATIKEFIKRALDTQIEYLRKQFQPQGQNSAPQKEVWLRNKLEVMDSLLTEVGQIRERFQVQGEDEQVLQETEAYCKRAKAELTTIESKVEGDDKYRKRLLDEVVGMRFLLNERLAEEDGLVAQLETLVAELGEDVTHVREIMEKEGFDDYISSDEEATDEPFIRLDEEGTADVEAITTSLEYRADDPRGSEAIQRYGHRQQGPLRSYAEERAAQLARRPKRRFGDRLSKPMKELTPELALMRNQEQAIVEIAARERSRQEAIADGIYDVRMDRIAPDPRQTERNAAILQEVNLWVEGQRGNAKYRSEKYGASPTGPPTDAALVAGSVEDNACQYLQTMIGGFTCMMFFNGPGGPSPRHVFMTKDLKRLSWRKTQRDGDRFDDESISMNDIRTVVTGHRTGVFKQHREANQTPLREAAALSVVTLQNTSLDIEFDTPEEREYWAQIISTVASEMKPGGTISNVITAGAIKVLDYSPPEQRSSSDEPYDRNHIQIKLKGSQ